MQDRDLCKQAWKPLGHQCRMEICVGERASNPLDLIDNRDLSKQAWKPLGGLV